MLFYKILNFSVLIKYKQMIRKGNSNGVLGLTTSANPRINPGVMQRKRLRRCKGQQAIALHMAEIQVEHKQCGIGQQFEGKQMVTPKQSP
jgi:hypothetical protein